MQNTTYAMVHSLTLQQNYKTRKKDYYLIKKTVLL